MAKNSSKDSQIVEAGIKTMANPPLIDSDSDDGMLSTYSLPTLPEITKSTEDQQQSLLTRSQYAMVVFHGVADTYPTDSDIVCRYSLTDGVEAAPGDRVVLFAVGWSSIKDYIVFEWAPIPEKDERDLTVVFKAADLPKDVNEFYQVCYVSNESAVCGASVPFQVRTPNNEELTFALEEDMVVVRSSTAVAQDKLLMAQIERESLNKEKLNLEKQLRSLEDKHSLTLRRLDRLQETLSTSNALNEELKKENSRLLDIGNEMEKIKEELEETRMKLEAAEIENKIMKEDLEALAVESICTQKRRDELEKTVRDLDYRLMDATEKIFSLQKQQEEFRTEIVTANGNLQQTESVKASLAIKNFALENELTVCKFNLNNSQTETLRLKTEIEELIENNKRLENELKSSKQSEEMHKNFHTEYSTTDRGRLMMENAALLKTTEQMQIAICTLEHEKWTLEQVLEDALNSDKNVCSDHCNLEKVVAQLQYRLEEATSNNEKAKEKKRVLTYGGPSSPPIENQVATLCKLLDESLKENELRQQENFALQVQNEILETRLSKDISKLEEYVVVSTSHNPCDNYRTNATQNRMPINRAINADVSATNADACKMNISINGRRMDDYAHQLAAKDAQICHLESEIVALKTEFLSTQEENKAEIEKLVSKNAVLVEQEIQSQELKNEMQKITFMNEELLSQNTSLMDRIHDGKCNSSTNTKVNVMQKASNTESVDQTIKMADETLREELKCLNERLELITAQYHKQEEGNKRLELELCESAMKNNIAEIKYSRLLEEYDILSNRLKDSEMQVDDKYHHECKVDPKLEQISQNVDHLLSAMEKLASCSRAEEGLEQSSKVVDDLKFRLQMAREEYEKLHTLMINYRTKYNELKTKFMKKGGKIYHSST